MKRKITSYYSLMVIAATLLVSCSNDEGVTPVSSKISNEAAIEKIVLEKTTLKELGFNSIEEFLGSGVTKEEIDEKQKTIKKKEIKNISATGKVISSDDKEESNAFETIREKMNASHVNQLALGNSKIKSIFKIGGNVPEGVTINDWRSSGAYSKLNLADEYGWYAYVQTGKAETTVKYLDSDAGYEITKFTSYNYSDKDDMVSRAVTYNTGTTTSWNASVTAGLTVNGSVGISMGISLTAGVQVKLEANVGAGGAKTVSQTQEYRYTTTLPAHSKRTIYLVQKRRESKVDYKIPVVITGDVALNFNQRVNGQNFLSSPASKLQEGKSNAQLGSIDYMTVYDVEIYGGPIESITGPIPIKEK